MAALILRCPIPSSGGFSPTTIPCADFGACHTLRSGLLGPLGFDTSRIFEVWLVISVSGTGMSVSVAAGG